MGGCVEMLEIDIAGIKTWAHAYVVPDAPYQLLLGQPWQRLVKLSKEETNDTVLVTIHDPLNNSNTCTCQTSPHLWPQPGSFSAVSNAFCIALAPVFHTSLNDTPLIAASLLLSPSARFISLQVPCTVSSPHRSQNSCSTSPSNMTKPGMYSPIRKSLTK